MFRTNAFGQRTYCQPRLRFLEGEEGEGGGEATTEPTPQEQGFDFPEGKSLVDMTEAQRTEYWRHKAQKHEKASKIDPDRLDQLRAAAAELEQLKRANATEQEKAIEDALRQGENLGAERYVKFAIKGEIRATAPHLKPEQVDELLSIINPSAVIRDDGEVDADKIGKIISSFAPAAKQETPGDSYSETIKQTRHASGAGSIAELKKRYQTTTQK